MRNDVILSIENVSKLYRLGTVGTGTFGGDVHRFWKTKILGQEDPFLKIGQTNDRTSKNRSEFVWALKDINFEVNRGEVLGIIGKNGAGKSTLLKLLSRITSPTTGIIKSAGRMSSLLEVGTGFHPELTGRENIYLNGAILGMTKKEIQNKFDEIVDFSGCEMYIDTPTKRYSSGMTVRLAFAVAAHLEPDILVVDEVLAVGDADFQKKAIGKMRSVSKDKGRTVLFVSHNMGAIAQLTQNVMVMENGKRVFHGPTPLGIDYYEQHGTNISTLNYNVETTKRDYLGNNKIRFLSVSFKNSQLFDFNSDITFFTKIIGNSKQMNFRYSLTIFSLEGVPVGSTFGEEKLFIEDGEIQEHKVVIPNPRLSFGKYYLGISVGKGNNKGRNEDFDVITNVLNFEVKPLSTEDSVETWNQGWGKIAFQNLITEIK